MDYKQHQFDASDIPIPGHHDHKENTLIADSLEAATDGFFHGSFRP